MLCCACRQQPIVASSERLYLAALRQMQILTGKHWMEVWDPCRRVSRRTEGVGNPLERPTVSTNLGTFLLLPLPQRWALLLFPSDQLFSKLYDATLHMRLWWRVHSHVRMHMDLFSCLSGGAGTVLCTGAYQLDLSSSPTEQIILFQAITLNQGEPSFHTKLFGNHWHGLHHNPYQGSVHACCAQSTTFPAIQNMPQS